MTLYEIETDIALAEHEFELFGASKVAERLSRLRNFRSHLFAREYALDRHDWIGPEDLPYFNQGP